MVSISIALADGEVARPAEYPTVRLGHIGKIESGFHFTSQGASSEL